MSWHLLGVGGGSYCSGMKVAGALGYLITLIQQLLPRCVIMLLEVRVLHIVLLNYSD